MSTDLKQALLRLHNWSRDHSWIPGRMGRLNDDGTYTVSVDGKPGWVHVRLGPDGRSGNTQALNDGAPRHPNLRIRMIRENGILVVDGRDRFGGATQTGGDALLQEHAWMHDRLGPDPLYIKGLAFLPLAARPTSPASMAVTVDQGFYRYAGSIEVWERGDTADLSAYIPASAALQHFVVISLDRESGALVITDGSEAPSAGSIIPFSPTDVQTIVDTLPDGYIPLAAVRFYYGQAAIRAPDIFMDLRLWGGDDIGGSSSGGVRSVTFVVAASNAGAASIAGADYACDGTADDVQIQAAIAALPAVGGTVYLTEGTFSFVSPVTISGSNVHVRGAGRDLTTLQGLTSGSGYIGLTPGTGNTITNISLTDFTISAGASGTEVTVGQIYQTDVGVIERLAIERIRITGTTSTKNGITFHNANDTSVNRYVWIRDCIIALPSVNTYGIEIRKNTEHLWIENCYVSLSSASSYNAIALYAGSSDFHVNNNYATSGHSPISCSPAENGEIIGNVVDGATPTAEGGIELERTNHSSSETSHHVVVANNLVRGGYWGIFTRIKDAGVDPQDIIIANNIVTDTNTDAIFVAQAERVTVVGNEVYNPGEVGIDLQTADDVNVVGNTVYSAGTVSIRTVGATAGALIKISDNAIIDGSSHGIHLSSGSGNYIVTDNYVYNAGGDGLVVATDNGFFTDNWFGTITGSVLTDTGTGNVYIANQPDSINDAQTDSDAIHDNVAGEIAAITEKAAPVDADLILIEDSEASNAKKKVQLSNLPGSGGDGSVALLYSQTVDATIAATTTEESLLSAGRGSKTLPADTLAQGTVIRLQLVGHISDTGNPTLNVKVQLGGTEVCSTGAQNLNTTVTTVDWRADVLIICRAAGVSGTVVAGGLFEHDDGTHFGMVKTSSTTVDTTGALEIDVTATWGTADAANTITCQQVTIEKMRDDALAPVGPTGLSATEI